MLIRNLSTIDISINVHLEHDDGTKTICILKRNDIGTFTFRHNDRLIKEYGTVKDIIQSFDYKLSKECKSSVCIILDTSKRFKSKEYKVALCDLINVELEQKIESVGPCNGAVSMKLISEEDCKEGRQESWHPLHPKREKK